VILGFNEPENLFWNKDKTTLGTPPGLTSVSSVANAYEVVFKRSSATIVLVSSLFACSTMMVSSLVSCSSSPSSIVVSAPFSSETNKIVGTIVIFTLSVYIPLSFVHIPNQPHDMSTGEYKKGLPKFVGNTVVFVEDQLTTFVKFIEDLEVEYEDDVMKMFVQTLEGDPSLLLPSMDGIRSRRNL
jgi:hypothetical protein